MTAENSNGDDEPLARFEEKIDFYYENGLMVLTERFLRRRGYCCKNGCRHCPYEFAGREPQSK